jgi:prophage regulatory protein
MGQNSPLKTLTNYANYEITGDLASMSTRKSRVAYRTTRSYAALSQDRNEPPLETRAVPRINPIRIVRLPQVIEATGLRKTKIYELQSQGLFSMRIQITAHTVGLVEEEIQAWLTRRIAPRPCLRAPRPAPSGLRAQS